MGALEDDLTEHHRIRERDQTIEALRKELAETKERISCYWNPTAVAWQLEAEKVRKELAEAYRLRDFHHNDAINSRLELEALRKELAEAKADWKEDVAQLRAANARIGELEEQLQECWQRNLKLSNTTTVRAERAEAECKALRAPLTRWLECMGNFAPPRLIDDTRAALNPSPAEPTAPATAQS